MCRVHLLPNLSGRDLGVLMCDWQYLVAKEAPDEFRKLVEELFGLQDVLRLLRDGVGSDMVVRADDRRKKAIERVIVATVRTLRELEMLVNKYHRMGLSDDRRLWKQIRSRLQWTMEQGAIEGFRKRIQAHTYTLSLSMSMIGKLVHSCRLQ